MSTQRFRRGLVVGKFSPLHRGHEAVIRRAMHACDEVLVLSYSQPVFPRCDAAARQRWLETAFPTARVWVLDDRRLAAYCAQQNLPRRTVPPNTADDDTQRAFVGWLCTHLLKLTVDAVFTSEDYGDGFAAHLQQWFATHAPGQVAHVAHICVDRERQQIPISATRIRANPHRERAYLSPWVYADFVSRICLLGGESSGKSTLARALATHLDTAWAHEYGRELWEQRAGQLDYADLLHIGQQQVAREDYLAQQAHRWLICDTSPLTTMYYSQAMFGCVDPALLQLAARRYDHVLLCAPDFPFVQDGTRRDDAFRMHQHAWYLAELQSRGMEFTLLEGTVPQRLARALRVLGEGNESRG